MQITVGLGSSKVDLAEVEQPAREGDREGVVEVAEEGGIGDALFILRTVQRRRNRCISSITSLSSM